jgi:hypothetical protein
MARTKLLTSNERFTELEGRLASNGEDAKARVMVQARKLFDDALVASSCFEEALAHVFAEGFDMGKASVKRRARKPKDQSAAGDL